MADKTVIVTGASQDIGADLANRFLEWGYNVVATSRRVAQSAEIGASDRLARVDGDIAEPETANAVGRNVCTVRLCRRSGRRRRDLLHKAVH